MFNIFGIVYFKKGLNLLMYKLLMDDRTYNYFVVNTSKFSLNYNSAFYISYFSFCTLYQKTEAVLKRIEKKIGSMTIIIIIYLLFNIPIFIIGLMFCLFLTILKKGTTRQSKEFSHNIDFEYICQFDNKQLI
ncbi:unnamed protein product [Paramecium sonneborni]|uniref:Uncharacterized protein n=1 Tax=Paramecium sonneborni TaxID=65129 RepID=A0A8S1JYL1_9CILI|nr:unnamed protein product [Paramecium sonneborni]